MRRFTTMKVAFASILSCLVILLGMFATTGTASANSANNPFINVSGFSVSGGCASFLLVGGGFSPGHHVDLSANIGASISPSRVLADGNGNFSVPATVCTNQVYSTCGTFIASPTAFCGYNLNEEEFCGLSGIVCSGFIGSAMQPAQCNPPSMNPNCNKQPCPPNQPNNNPMCHMRHGNNGSNGNHGPNGNNGNTGPNGPMGPQSGCHSNQMQCCHQFPNSTQCRNQGNHFPYTRFRFHRVTVLDFCRFHFHQNFPFCFRYFPQEFVISVIITARDVHTGARAHAVISIG
jgi:hypothetical protein